MCLNDLKEIAEMLEKRNKEMIKVKENIEKRKIIHEKIKSNLNSIERHLGNSIENIKKSNKGLEDTKVILKRIVNMSTKKLVNKPEKVKEITLEFFCALKYQIKINALKKY